MITHLAWFKVQRRRARCGQTLFGLCVQLTLGDETKLLLVDALEDLPEHIYVVRPKPRVNDDLLHAFVDRRDRAFLHDSRLLWFSPPIYYSSMAQPLWYR